MRRAIVLLLVVAASGCDFLIPLVDGAGDGGTASDVDAGTGGVEVGPAGGTVSADGVTLSVPPGALAADTALTVGTSAVSPPSGVRALGAVFQFGPDGTRFASPVTVTIALDQPPAGARIYWSNGSGGFDPLASTIGASGVSAQVSHFSQGFVGLPAGPTPEVFAAGEHDPFGIAADSYGVYWTNREEGTVKMVPRVGGQLVVVQSAATGPSQIVADGGGGFYWLNDYAGNIQSARAWDPTPYDVATGQLNPRGISWGSPELYWTTYSAAPPGGALWYARSDGGGTPNLVFSGRAYGVVATPSDVLYADDTAVWRIGPTGGTPVRASAGSAATLFAVNSYARIAWTDGAGGLWTWSGNAALRLASVGVVEGLAADQTHVYWTDDASIHRVALDGSSAPELVIDGQPGAGPIAVDERDVYWANSNVGSFGVPILRVPKP